MVIAHLYWDLLNLYGNDGNIKILSQKLTDIGEDVEVRRLSVGDKFDFSCYDIVYIGSGTESNQKIAIKDLKPYKDELAKAISSGKVFLCTGNSIDMFGKGLSGGKEEDIEGIGIFDYQSVYVDRIKKMYRCDDNFLGKPILGFFNHNYVLRDNTCPLFDDTGVHTKNFFGTYAEGPVLVRNPHFLKYIMMLLLQDEKKIEEIDLELEERAYQEYIQILET